ncbi:hypothetical protein [Methylobacterium sp. R2-1]|uniref:hypothetical protein n=1 Tax=Methylobacterium sp. R2-1 TaxID=2587064 RepID=UPI00161829D9|nr:hypothetical protein [Methylobacterium sp. R2-1]MBB2962569.1 hypothetical protein [Methylobacterium sp. R2-1]
MKRSILPLILLTGLTVPALSRPAAAVEGSPVLLHGNYCGPGNKAPAAPVDALDAACARHDACTPDGALAPKACNLRLQVDAERVADDPRQPTDLRMLAGLVASGAAMMPSAPSSAPRAPAAPAAVEVESTPDADLLPE